jgi:hypothetical protein
MAQLHQGESFGELLFRLEGLHTRRNAGVLSDRSGETLPILSPGASSSDDDDDINDDDACVLLLVPEQCYVSEMIARHAVMHQTRDKIYLLASSPLFRHCRMDQLIELAYAMRKKSFEGGEAIVRQGERVDHVWMIKNGIVRILHNVLPPTRSEGIVQGMCNDAHKRRQLKAPISVYIVDLRAREVIDLTECIEESSTRMSQAEAVALTKTEVFFVP